MKKIFFKWLCWIAAGTMFLTACGGPAKPVVSSNTQASLSGTISVSGAFALYPMMTVWASEFQKLNPEVQFDIQAGGAGKGMTDALVGAVDIGMVSRAIQPAEEAKGAFWVPVAKDAVFPIVSEKNPVLADLMAKGISPAAFKKIFITGEITTWGEVVGKSDVTDAIHVYTRSDSAGAADMWAQFSGGKAQADILKTAIGINGEPALVDMVIKDPLGIAYSNLNSVFDVTGGNIIAGTVVPPIDINGSGQITSDQIYKTTAEAANAVSTGKYPSPPARFENLVTRGQPTGLVKVFLTWVLTDGQKDLSQAGYVPLTSEQQADALAKLK